MEMKVSQKNGAIWMLRQIGKTPNGYISFNHDRTVNVFFWNFPDIRDSLLGIDRRTARLLARRINQALDETKYPQP